MQCPSCGKQIPDSSTFCLHCGARLVAPTARVSTREVVTTAITCPKCGRNNPADTKFCQKCGTSLTVSCPRCGSQNAPTTEFCGNCGVKLSEATFTQQARVQEMEPGQPPAAKPSGDEWWKKVLGAVGALVCTFVGIGLLIAAGGYGVDTATSAVYVLLGLAAIGAAVVGTVITNCWGKIDSLPSGGRKVIAYAFVITGGIAASGLVLIVWVAIAAAGSSLKDMEAGARSAQRQREIERGVEGALKKRGF